MLSLIMQKLYRNLETYELENQRPTTPLTDNNIMIFLIIAGSYLTVVDMVQNTKNHRFNILRISV
jgi:hypothetical protein